MPTTNQAVQPEINQRMNAYELSQTVEFGHLSPKMATWVRTYVQSFLETGSFDPLAATKAAYTCHSDESARTFGYQLMAHPKIILALNRFFGATPEESFLKQVEKAIYSRRLTIAQVRALELMCRAKGWANGIPRAKDINLSRPEADEPEGTSEEASVAGAVQTFPIGAVLVQDNKRYRVVAEEIS